MEGVLASGSVGGSDGGGDAAPITPASLANHNPVNRSAWMGRSIHRVFSDEFSKVPLRKLGIYIAIQLATL